MTPIEQAIEALTESRRTTTDIDVLNKVEAALAALRAQPVEPFKKLSDDEVLWLAQSHGIDVYACNPLAFYADLISTTPAQPDHSELVRRLRHTASKGVSVWGDLMIEAADALEGK